MIFEAWQRAKSQATWKERDRNKAREKEREEGGEEQC
jgi:hypothetical protein